MVPNPCLAERNICFHYLCVISYLIYESKIKKEHVLFPKKNSKLLHCFFLISTSILLGVNFQFGFVAAALPLVYLCLIVKVAHHII